jgi:hypothetical protein
MGRANPCNAFVPVAFKELCGLPPCVPLPLPPPPPPPPPPPHAALQLLLVGFQCPLVVLGSRDPAFFSRQSSGRRLDLCPTSNHVRV